ncbi:hypothetical protein [Flavobacterium branchiicola]|uniref:Outer membrane protein beta-barrel domain-containing protein n=1 Tax=Flavobacterium branchiicola TaxID=1114875 RepID=A0ABV9PIL9_9FLAO|nr:hypothetical protein [Flavobacterium branchiicola]MBS7255694.1 hypothetical protein [Flavobacterium branchiicola]
MKKEKIEDIFSSMENFASIPPPELWANIEEKLDKPKKKKRAILWWSAAACLLLGLLLPSVLYFTSNSGIKTINGDIINNNSVVLDENQKESKDKSSITLDENKNDNVQKSNTTEKQVVENPENQTDKNAIINTYSNVNSNPAVSNAKSAVVSTDNKINNNSSAQKTSVSEKENQFNSFSKHPNLNTSKNSKNQSVAEKGYYPKQQNSFNSASKMYVSDPEKKNADKVLAEKTFKAGKTNSFNTASTALPTNSIFEKYNSSNTVASNSFKNDKQAVVSGSKREFSTEIKSEKTTSEKAIADNNLKNNSRFGSALSKQDSIQLAELQNLEKGIIAQAPENKKDKKDKKEESLDKTDKWAVQVFAGVASSENYKNDRTLGNVNDSKQSNSYGVKTKYKVAKKWAVASGFKINELGQSVANVAYMNVKSNAFFGTGDYLVQNSTVPQIATNEDYVLVSNSTKNALKSDNIQSGNLDQSLRYVEMPLEVSYAIFSKNKANITLNTGGFVGKLISNNVALDGYSIGKNVNANDFVYGSTLSSTVQYRVYKKTNVFVEPAVNYYVNPLNSQSFNQVQWGLNFGLNVSF